MLEMVAMKENEKLGMKSHLEAQLALERKLSEQKERNLRLEWELKEQIKMQEGRKEVTVRANLAPRLNASTTVAPVIPSFARPTLTPKHVTKMCYDLDVGLENLTMDQGAERVGRYLRLLPDGTHTSAYTQLILH